MSECQLLHVRCTSCGYAIHTSGSCECDDNRHHPIADLHADTVTGLRGDVADLKEALGRTLYMLHRIDAAVEHSPLQDDDRLGCDLKTIRAFFDHVEEKPK